MGIISYRFLFASYDSELLEEIVAPVVSHLVIEDDIPLGNFQTEKQQRLLVEPLYSSWNIGVEVALTINSAQLAGGSKMRSTWLSFSADRDRR